MFGAAFQGGGGGVSLAVSQNVKVHFKISPVFFTGLSHKSDYVFRFNTLSHVVQLSLLRVTGPLVPISSNPCTRGGVHSGQVAHSS